MIDYLGIDKKIRRCENHEDPTKSGMITTVVNYREININKEGKYGYEQEG